MFQKNEAYTIKMIADSLGKSENYVAKKLKTAGISPEGELITAMGPNAKVWKGFTVNRMINDGIFRNNKVGDVVWYDSKPTQVYLVKGYLMVDGARTPIYKIGLTQKEDVIKDRFKEEVSTGLLEDLELLASTWFNSRADAEGYETSLFNLTIEEFGGYKMKDGSIKFHNFWTQQQPKGITEMRKLNIKEVSRLIEVIESKNLSKSA